MSIKTQLSFSRMEPDGNKSSVIGRFSTAASTYDGLADTQKSVAIQLIEGLLGRPSPRSILEVGCGSGQLTRLMCEAWPETSIDAIDASAAMITEAGRKLPLDSRVALHVADAQSFSGRGCYELVVSSSSLHWMFPLRDVIRHLAEMVEPGGCFAHAVMLAGTLGELHSVRRQVAPDKIPLKKLPEAGELLKDIKDAGLVVENSHKKIMVATYPSATEFLRSIHDQGVTGGDLSHSNAFLTRGELARLVTEYEKRHRTVTGQISATFHVLFLMATKPKNY